MNQGGRDDSYRIYDCDELRISFRSSVRPSFCALLSQRHAPPVANNKIPTYLPTTTTETKQPLGEGGFCIGFSLVPIHDHGMHLNNSEEIHSTCRYN